MTDEDKIVSQAELKQAAKNHSLTTWQKQWDASKKERLSQKSLRKQYLAFQIRNYIAK